MRHPMGERVGFARACAGDDQQRAGSELRGFMLLRIQRIEGRRVGHACNYTATFAVFFACLASVKKLAPAPDPPYLSPFRITTFSTGSVRFGRNWMAVTKLVGQNYETPDIRAKVTGRARYSEDFRAPGMLFARLLLSPYAHPKIRS